MVIYILLVLIKTNWRALKRTRNANTLNGWLRELKVFKSIDVKNVEDLIIGINY